MLEKLRLGLLAVLTGRSPPRSRVGLQTTVETKVRFPGQKRGVAPLMGQIQLDLDLLKASVWSSAPWCVPWSCTEGCARVWSFSNRARLCSAASRPARTHPIRPDAVAGAKTTGGACGAPGKRTHTECPLIAEPNVPSTCTRPCTSPHCGLC